eukprot:1327538-Rhodomonas_salina.1
MTQRMLLPLPGTHSAYDYRSLPGSAYYRILICSLVLTQRMLLPGASVPGRSLYPRPRWYHPPTIKRETHQLRTLCTGNMR